MNIDKKFMAPILHLCDERKEYFCQKCRHLEKIHPREINLFAWYCVKCMEKLLDQHIGKMIPKTDEEFEDNL
jgi:predicted SprT family Zn-dependent metalloprotease